MIPARRRPPEPTEKQIAARPAPPLRPDSPPRSASRARETQRAWSTRWLPARMSSRARFGKRPGSSGAAATAGATTADPKNKIENRRPLGVGRLCLFRG